MTYRAPKTNGHAHLGRHMRHALMLKAVRQIKQTFGCCFVGCIHWPRQRWQHTRHPTRRNGIASRFNLQALNLALRIQCGTQLCNMHGAVVVVRHVLLARPDQLHWRAISGHGQLRSLHNHIHFQTPAKSTT